MHFEIIGIRTEKTLVKVSSPYPFRDIVYSSSLSLPGNAFIHCFCVSFVLPVVYRNWILHYWVFLLGRWLWTLVRKFLFFCLYYQYRYYCQVSIIKFELKPSRNGRLWAYFPCRVWSELDHWSTFCLGTAVMPRFSLLLQFFYWQYESCLASFNK